METPLMVASRAGHFGIVKALLGAGANIDHLNEVGSFYVYLDRIFVFYGRYFRTVKTR
jgi:ankyrin repeat protein